MYKILVVETNESSFCINDLFLHADFLNEY